MGHSPDHPMELKVGGRVTYAFPGKTFLAGEYLALAGGPSLLLATGPAFEFTVERVAEPLTSTRASAGVERPGHLNHICFHPFAAQSPAGLWLAKYPELLRSYRISFSDPHEGRGGLGASTAQFAGAWAFSKGLRQGFQSALASDESGGANADGRIKLDEFNWTQLLRDYRSVAWNGEGLPPSGADLVTQLVGGVTWFDGVAHRVRSFEWAFPQLEFTLIRTGKKLATHEHLRAAGSHSQAALHEALRPAVELARTAIESCNEQNLVEAVSRAASALRNAGLAAPGTLELLERLGSVPGLVRAAKGCGAMGADVVLVVHDRSERARIKAWAEGEGLMTCGTNADLGAGLMARTT
jgi:mevalonate kinase